MSVRELVRDEDVFRWYHREDNAIQTLVNVSKPEKLLMPVYQAMIIFLLWQKSPIKVANIGMGAAGIENTLLGINDIDVVSIEQSADVIDIARTYFSLPSNHAVRMEQAESFLGFNPRKPENEEESDAGHVHSQVNKHEEAQSLSKSQSKSSTDALFDILLVDIFVEMLGEKYLNDVDFYTALKAKLNQAPDSANARGVFFNVSVNSAEQLITLIRCLHQVFAHSAIIEFEHYKNIIIYMSDAPVPSQTQLTQLNEQQRMATGDTLAEKLKFPIDFSPAISNMRVIK